MIKINITYRTKFATGELFTVTDIQKKEVKDKETNQMIEKIVSIKGFYSNSPHLLNCPISIDRLIDPEEKVEVKQLSKESKDLLTEIQRRQQLIISEPNGMVRETMIENLLIDL